MSGANPSPAETSRGGPPAARVVMTHVSKTYGDAAAIVDLDLEVLDGELVVLAGPPGCGGSLALRLVAGLEEVTGGEIAIAGRVVNDVPPVDRDVAMVFRSFALYPHMTVRENLAFGLRIRKLEPAEIDRRVGEAAELLGLAPLLDRRPRQLADGERQRVGVARAVARRPSLLLCDEPLANLGGELRGELRAEIAKLQRHLAVTTLYATSEPVEAMTLGHRIALLRDGALQQVGAPLEIYETPANVFAATFFGTPPMNLFTARVTAGGERLAAARFEVPVPEPWRGLTRGADGRELVVGIRPENLLAAGGGARGPTSRITADVEVTETLGREVLVRGRAGDVRLVATAAARHGGEPGHPLDLVVELDGLHLFDAETGSRLTAAERAPRA